MENRRSFLKSAGAAGTVALTGLAGCSSGGGDGETSNDGDGSGNGTTTTGTSKGSKKVRFILSPAESKVDIKKQYKGMFDHIESETGATVEPTVASSYTALFQALKSNQADIADASPTLAVVGAEKDVTEVVGLRVAYGAAKYFSLMTTHPDSGISKPSDLKGEDVVFADPASTSGSLFPLYMLKQAGLDVGDAPDGDPVDFNGKWTKSHDIAASQVKKGNYAAAGTGAFVVADNIPDDQFPDRFMNISSEASPDESAKDPKLDLVKASEPIPRAPILTRSSWDASVRDGVEKALLSATEDDLKNPNASEDNQIWFTGIQEGSSEDYKPVKKVKNALGIEFGN